MRQSVLRLNRGWFEKDFDLNIYTGKSSKHYCSLRTYENKLGFTNRTDELL